jgi:hypothetical protein
MQSSEIRPYRQETGYIEQLLLSFSKGIEENGAENTHSGVGTYEF